MTKYDKVLIASILVVSIAGFLFTGYMQDSQDHLYAVIVVNGKEYKRIDLMNAAPGEFTVRTPWGYNTVQVGKNRIRIKEASCPDKLCVKEGWLDKPNQMAVCLPNRVYIKIIGKEVEVDDIAF